jgi:hypothetical protein
MTRTVFYGFGATVGAITGPTSVGWWHDDPVTLNWAHGTLIPIDLGKNPQAHRSGKIKVHEIEADDYHGYTFGGLSRLGPMWPGGVMSGILWVESNYWARLGPKGIQPPRLLPHMQCHDYEMCTVLYWEGPLAHRRFQGLHAEIHSVQGTNALTTIWQAGTSKIPGHNPLGTYWLDLAQVAHPIEHGFTTIGVGPNEPKSGALFLDLAQRRIIPFSCPKVPKWLGGVVPTRKYVVR